MLDVQLMMNIEHSISHGTMNVEHLTIEHSTLKDDHSTRFENLEDEILSFGHSQCSSSLSLVISM